MLKLSPKLSRKAFQCVVAGLAMMLATSTAHASHLRRGPTAGKSHKKHGAAAPAHVTSTRPRGMDDARASVIQTALVKAGYLENASGHWDDTSAAAMRKLQSDNGWQTKLIPDSRALIKLGLGPNSDAQVPAAGSSMTGSQPLHDSTSVTEAAAAQN